MSRAQSKNVFLLLLFKQGLFSQGSFPKNSSSRRGCRSNAGFTLLELLIVIVITGILSAIALPSFLNQKTKAQETEGKTYIGTLNRAQQAHYTVYQKFAGSIADLGIGIREQTNLYSYEIATGDGVVTNKARSQNPELRGYAGVVASSRTQMSVVLCRATQKGVAAIANGEAIGEIVQCPQNYEPMP